MVNARVLRPRTSDKAKARPNGTGEWASARGEAGRVRDMRSAGATRCARVAFVPLPQEVTGTGAGERARTEFATLNYGSERNSPVRVPSAVQNGTLANSELLLNRAARTDEEDKDIIVVIEGAQQAGAGGDIAWIKPGSSDSDVVSVSRRDEIHNRPLVVVC